MDNSFGKKFINLIFNNSQIVALLFGFVVVAGAVSFYFFQPQGFPTFSINMAVVTAKYPGATALQVEDKLIKPIEQAVGEVKTVEEYTSTANDSFAVVVVTFKDGTQMAEAMRDLDGKLASVVVPEGADKPEAKEIDATGPITIVAVTTDTGSGTVNDWDLYRKANTVRDKLETVKGVKTVKVMNPLTPEITITFDQAKLDKLGIQRSQVEGMLKTAQFEMPIGSYYDAQSDKYALGVKKDLADIKQLEEMMIVPGLALKDIAKVETVLNNSDQYNRIGRRVNDEDVIADAGDFQIERAIVLSVTANEKEDIIGLGKRLDDTYKELEDQAGLAPNLKITKVYDMAAQTADQLKEIKESVVGGPIEALGPWGVIGYLFGGITLVVLFLLIFVNWRVAILAGLSIPLAIGMTTAYLKLTGVSINTIVLFSMILVVGLVVDPTIVFLEAMQRYKEQGYKGREAAIKTFNSVGVGVLLSAIANFVVFVPFGVVSGFFGQIIQYIPQTVIPAIVASFIVPTLFFLPVASGWLKSHRQVQTNENPELVGIWSLSRWVGRMIQGLLGGGVGRSIARTFIILVAVIAPVAVSMAFIGSEKVKIVQFASPDDSDMVLVYGTVNERWAFSKAIGVIDPVQKYLAEQKEVRKFVVYEQSGNSFTLFVELFPMLERSKDDLRTATEFVDDTNKYLATISNAEVEAGIEGGGPPTERYPVSIRLFNNDLAKLQTAADDVAGFLKDQAGVTKVENSLNNDGKNSGTLLVLDSKNPINLNPFAVANAIRDRLNETDVVNMQFGGETFKVTTKTNATINSIDLIKQVPVAVGAGSTAMAPGRATVAPMVNDLITGVSEQKAQSIERLDGKRYVAIKAKVDKDTDPLKVQQELTKYLDKDKLESLGLDSESATETKGVAGSVAKSFTQLLLALILAMFLIYVILVGFFRSILSPLIILFAVPLGFIGVFPAVAVATGQLGFLELLGVVAMAGIVVNVTILIIDFANQMRAKGMTAQEAIATSIAVRFKPILLTKMTVFAGLMPLALFSPFWRGLAAVIVFGIIVSGFLSFITTPILYTWFDALGKGLKRKPTEPVMSFPTNPMQAAPMVQTEQAAVSSMSSRAGLWGELPDQSNQSQQSDQSNQQDWDQ
jgi:HAE1 family hydrophobic/amphiphilic exporter-1